MRRRGDDLAQFGLAEISVVPTVLHRAVQGLEERGWKIRDMMTYPTVRRYRNSKNEIEDVNLFTIKAKYKARPRSKKKVEA